MIPSETLPGDSVHLCPQAAVLHARFIWGIYWAGLGWVCSSASPSSQRNHPRAEKDKKTRTVNSYRRAFTKLFLRDLGHRGLMRQEETF